MLNNEETYLDQFKIWSRKIINAYWIVSLLCFLGQIIFLILNLDINPNYSIRRFLIRYILIPDIIILCILNVTEIAFRYLKRHDKYLIIITSIGISYTVFFSIASNLSGREIVVVIPILIAILYFSKRVLIITFLINLSIIWLLYFVILLPMKLMNVFELVILTFASLTIVLIGIGIVNRGIYLINSIIKLSKNQEKLIIEKSIIDKASKTDSLTGLYNHRTFHEYIDTLLNEFRIYNFQLQLAIIDIDDFKNVNDKHGHWSGDMVLKEVAEILQHFITVDDFVARYGGEEFAIIFIGKNLKDTLNTLEILRKTISEKKFTDLGNKSVTVSIGVHNYLSSDNKELLFKYADSALYEAKSQGKNRVICNSSKLK